jgi:predicted metal-binding membrane protein
MRGGSVTAVQEAGPIDRTPVLAVGLLVVAGLGWWWSVNSAGSMTGRPSLGMGDMGSRAATMSLGGFFLAWVAMMGAMMFPAVLPAVRLFDRAAARDQAVATPIFVAGYFSVWSAVGVPVYFAWRALAGPLVRGDRWAAYLAAGVFAAAATYQISPLKLACLRHCRSPLSFFMRQRYNLKKPSGAVRAGIAHGLICLGCCWAEMAILIALGTMNIGWMLAVAALIYVEKATRLGRQASVAAAIFMLVFGAALLVHPHLLVHLT